MSYLNRNSERSDSSRRNTLDIVSLNSDSNLSEDEDEDSVSESRARRIEELANKMLGEQPSTRTRHPSDPGVTRSLHDILGELDTVRQSNGNFLYTLQPNSSRGCFFAETYDP